MDAGPCGSALLGDAKRLKHCIIRRSMSVDLLLNSPFGFRLDHPPKPHSTDPAGIRQALRIFNFYALLNSRKNRCSNTVRKPILAIYDEIDLVRTMLVV